MKNTLSIDEVLRLLPHRPPFLLVDGVVDYEVGVSLHAVKCVSINEPVFAGHFPDKPILPGVMIIEALSQAAGLLGALTLGVKAAKEVYLLVGVEEAKFKHPVRPGDMLQLLVTLEKSRRGIFKFSAEARVGEYAVCYANLTFAIREV